MQTRNELDSTARRVAGSENEKARTPSPPHTAAVGSVIGVEPEALSSADIQDDNASEFVTQMLLGV